MKSESDVELRFQGEKNYSLCQSGINFAVFSFRNTKHRRLNSKLHHNILCLLYLLDYV